VFSESQATIFQHKSFKPDVRQHNIGNSVALNQSPPFQDFKLSARELRDFKDNGYIVVKNAIPSQVLEDAIRAINRAIAGGQHGGREGLVRDGLASDQNGLFDESVRSSPEVRALFRNSKVWRICECILGKNQVVPPNAGQVALRYPLEKQQVPNQLPRDRWHVDGMKDFIWKFKLLISVCLSPWQTPMSGQFTVFPGKHHEIFKSLSSMGQLNFLAGYRAPRPQMDVDAVQIIAQPGDVVIAHPLLPHRGGPNYSCNIRYACFFRLFRPSSDRFADPSQIPIRDVLQDCDGLKATLGIR